MVGIEMTVWKGTWKPDGTGGWHTKSDKDIIEQYNSARLTPAPAQMLKDAIDEIVRLRAENEKLRAALATAWEPFELIAKNYGPYDPKDRGLSDYVDGYVQACDDIVKAVRNYQLILNSSNGTVKDNLTVEKKDGPEPVRFTATGERY